MAFNASSDSSRTGIQLVLETTPGTTPDTPTGKELEITGESLQNARNTINSASFSTDRQIPGATKVGESNTGDINFEMKYGGVIDDIFEAVLQGTWAADSVSNGTTRRAFTIQKEFGGVTGDKCQIFRGAEFTSMTLEVSADAMITATVGVMARKYAIANASIMTATTPAPTTKFMTSVSEDAGVEIDGVAYTGGLASFSLNIDNGGREQKQIASTELAGIGMGRFNVSGSLTAYFNGTNTLYTKYKNEETFELTLIIPDPDGNKYEITLHEVTLSSAPILAAQADQDVMMEVNFFATKAANGKTMTITRVDAV